MARRIFILIEVLTIFCVSGCAVHYFDAESSTEHVWGIGHMAMKVGPPSHGLKAVGYRTDLIGVGVGSLQRDIHVELGWGARQRIEVVDENSALCLAWPRGSFYDVRVGPALPFEMENADESRKKEERP